ncbi:hypothetical protein XU18_2902 [Perkinsela sp. CCAP 1560/4]|nr:hypothetical protein XU18_2902 [Perkinsela sp. CCAP 1560/4]|eukprot:KNH06397.1 hypothetical protein XU18_2902 [Perkinsela sp. CCAP 1560/4]
MIHFARHPPCLQYLLDYVKREEFKITPFDFYGLCHTMDSTPWTRAEADVWRAIGRISNIIPIVTLPGNQNKLLVNMLNNQGVLPLKYQKIVSVLTPEQGQMQKMNAEELIKSIQGAYEKGQNGRKMVQSEMEPFFRRCADVCYEFPNETLMHVMHLLAINECRANDVLRRLTQRVLLRLDNLPTHDVCTLLHCFATLTSNKADVMRRVSSAIFRRQDEIVYEDVVRALRGMAIADASVFDRRLFDVLVRKVMEEVNEAETTNFRVLQLLVDTASKNLVQLPGHFINSLLRYSCQSVRGESKPRLISSCFNGFVRLGVRSIQQLEHFSEKIIGTVRLMDIASVTILLESCALLDEPLVGLILALLDRAADICQQGHVDQCIRILSFLSKLAGGDQHRLVEAMTTHIGTLTDAITPFQASELLIYLLKLRCKHHNVLLMLARAIVVRTGKDMATANAVARVCFDTGCRDKMFLNFYQATAVSLFNTLRTKDLVLMYQTILALQIEDPTFLRRIVKTISGNTFKNSSVQRQLPQELQKALADYKEVARVWAQKKALRRKAFERK